MHQELFTAVLRQVSALKYSIFCIEHLLNLIKS